MYDYTKSTDQTSIVTGSIPGQDLIFYWFPKEFLIGTERNCNSYQAQFGIY